MGLKLFDGSDSENDNDDPKIEVDQEFARRYEHNKKREDLHRYEELKKRGLVPAGEDSDDSYSSSSSEDDGDDELAQGRSEKDLEFFEALIKVRKKDPVLKSKDVKLFDSDSDSDENNDGEKNGDMKKKKKKKAMYLKDVVAKQLIEEGPDFDEDENENDGSRRSNKLVYDEEQEEIRRAFLKAAEGDGGEEDGDLLTVKAKGGGEESDNEELRKKVDEYFDDELDENGKFLKEYFLNKMWIDKRGGGERDGADDGEDDGFAFSDDEEEVEKQEEYEFRFQENAGDRVLGHSREVEGTVRKKVKARKEQRKNKQERMEIARKEREEELKHLKNLKKKEMDERIRKVMEVAGIKEDDVVPLSAKELEEEFDPEGYDRMMKRAFGDEYYAKMDSCDENSDDDDYEKEKPDFDEEDELLGLPKGWDGRGTDDDGFLAARERSLKHKTENESNDEEEEEDTKVGKRKRKRKLALLEKAKKAMLEEYYKLDYEDTIGDLKTRFRYSNVNRNRYGLSTAEILMMDDNELNQYVSMKKIVPYSDKEWKVPNSKRFDMKMKAKELLWKGRPSEGTVGRKKRKKDFDANKSWPSTSSGVAGEDSKATLENPAGEPSRLSRTAKRRKNQAGLRLSHSRLVAYKKITPKQKKKEKH